MTYELVLLKRAKEELINSWEWYEDKQPGLGDRFKDEIYACLHNLATQPEHYPIRKSPYREALVDIFPYLIIYRILKKEKYIVVSSIFYASRNPKKKYK
jgi:plasmid stabilization system protein ParE